MTDEIREYYEKMHPMTRKELAKQMIFDCAMELEYHYENLPNELLSAKLFDAIRMLDTE